MKILAIGDTADNIFTLKKFTKKCEIHLITFPRKGSAKFTNSYEGIEFFESLLISKQVKYIKKIKDDYDLCLVMSWAGGRIAYLAGLNYVMFFVGNDIRTPPFDKNAKEPYLRSNTRKFNYIERKFYKLVIDNAISCVAFSPLDFESLKKYRKDALKMDKIPVDTTLYNEKVKPIDRKKSKFTFLSPQRFGIEKGMDIIWEALKFCKTDFEILQVNWIDERNEEEKSINRKLFDNAPKQIKLIPLIKQKEMARFYNFADAVLGQMRAGAGPGGIEREAAFCKRPILNYTDPKIKMIIDGKEYESPFIPKSKDPKELAKLIDKVVENKKFRDELAEKEFEFVKKQSNPDKVAGWWENLFLKIKKKYPTINRKNSRTRSKIEFAFAILLEKLIYNRTLREKNIKAWGKEEYEKLSK